MNYTYLSPGIYLNIFPVEIPKDEIQVMTASRSSFQDLRPLRQYFEKDSINARVYAVEDTVFGYGPDAESLEKQGFRKKLLRLAEEPKLASRIIIEGLLDKFKSEGFQVLRRKGRWQIYNPKLFTEIANGMIRVYRGYDLRVFFWKDVSVNQIVFGLIVDVIWVLRSNANQPLNMNQIRKQYGYKAIVYIGQVQGEYLPGSNRINTEIARQRFHEHILPFVKEHSQFDLPCGGQAYLLFEPVRVILGGEEQ